MVAAASGRRCGIWPLPLLESCRCQSRPALKKVINCTGWWQCCWEEKESERERARSKSAGGASSCPITALITARNLTAYELCILEERFTLFFSRVYPSFVEVYRLAMHVKILRFFCVSVQNNV